MKQTWMIAIGLFMVLVGFQNCAETKFGGTASGSEKGQLVDMNLDQDDIIPDNPQTPPNPPPDDKKPPKEPPTNPETPVYTDDDDDNGDDLVACILVKHGKSVKLGYVQDSLEGVNSVAQSVCISRAACLEIVPSLFEVEGAYERGYCKGNPNVKRLSDQEVQDLVDEALAAQ